MVDTFHHSAEHDWDFYGKGKVGELVYARGGCDFAFGGARCVFLWRGVESDFRDFACDFWRENYFPRDFW